MADIRKPGLLFLLWSTLAGTIAFFISAGIIDLLLPPVDYAIIDVILVGGFSGLLLGIFLLKKYNIIKMILACLIAVSLGFWAALLLAQGLVALFSVIGLSPEDPVISNVSNILAITFQGMLCNAIFGGIIYGRKSILIFSIIGGAISFPFGILVGLFNSNHPIRTTFEKLLNVFGTLDLNFLAILTSFGIAIGLSIGIYEKLNTKQTK